MKYGDRNFRKYYPSMLFASLGNALYEILCYKYPLWKMELNGLRYSMIPMLLLTLMGMPLSTWIYLSKYPYERSNFRKGIYVTIFIPVFIIIEYVSVKMGAITYHHGWNLWWSLAFVIVMFAVIRLHFTRPIISILLSIPFALLLCMIFKVTLDKMKLSID